MKKVGLFVICILLISFASAEIIITKQPSGTYNLGESIEIPVTLKSLTTFYGSLNINLICDGQEVNFYKNGINLAAGEEKKIAASLILTKDAMDGIKGNCKIKAILGTEYSLTSDFIISNSINVVSTVQKLELLPGEEIIAKGNAIKESGKAVEGFVRLEVLVANEPTDINQLSTINKGSFSVTAKIPSEMKAGKYTIKITAYERTALEEITNEGFSLHDLTLKQKPTNIEILVDSSEIEPGTFIRARTILHDQTGESMPAPVVIIIQDSEGKLKEKIEIATGEYFEIPFPSNEAPADFYITATSEGISSQSSFSIRAKEDIKITLLNKTLTIINTGNIKYCNKTALIKIGEQKINLPLCLGVGDKVEYAISAPDGEYEVEIITEGEDNVKGTVALTGKAISIKEISGGISTLSRHPFIWIFVIGILGFMAMTMYKKGYKRSFVGTVKTTHHKPLAHKKQEEKTKPIHHHTKPAVKSSTPLIVDSSANVSSKAELSLSMQGEKQNIPMITLQIKNLGEIESQKGSGKETIQHIISIVEDNKGLVYENQSNIAFLFSPSITKTFKNEMNAIATAQKIKSMIENHNRMFRQKVNAGISVNYGTIIGKQESDSFKFMSMGTLITMGKKLASQSNGEILISDKLREVLPPNVKTEKQVSDNMSYYKLYEVKDTEDHQKFIRRFLENNKD